MRKLLLTAALFALPMMVCRAEEQAEATIAAPDCVDIVGEIEFAAEYPPLTADCIDSKSGEMISCLDGKKIAMFTIHATSIEDKPVDEDIGAYTIAVLAKDFDANHLKKLANKKPKVSFCGVPVESFYFLPENRQRDVARYQIDKLETIQEIPEYP